MNAIDSHVNDNRAGFDHVVGYKMRASNSRNHNVRLASDVSQILSFGVADGDGAISSFCIPTEKQRHGSAYN